MTVSDTINLISGTAFFLGCWLLTVWVRRFVDAVHALNHTAHMLVLIIEGGNEPGGGTPKSHPSGVDNIRSFEAAKRLRKNTT